MLALHDTVADPDPVTLVGVIAPHDRPDGRVSVRLMMPAKWFRLDSVIVDSAGEPVVTGEGVDVRIAKSLNWNMAVALWTRELLFPVTVRV